MSQENVELVYRILDAFNRRDLGTFLGLIDPEVEFTTRVVRVEGEPHYHGHDGIRDWWQDLLATFPDFSIEAIEVRDLGENTLINAHIRGHGGDSDAPFEQRIWQANGWRNGKLVWWHTFDNEAEALPRLRPRPLNPPGFEE